MKNMKCGIGEDNYVSFCFWQNHYLLISQVVAQLSLVNFHAGHVQRSPGKRQSFIHSKMTKHQEKSLTKKTLIDTFKISGQFYHFPVGEIDLKTVGEKQMVFK